MLTQWRFWISDHLPRFVGQTASPKKHVLLSGCWIGILIMVYCNPDLTRQHNPLYPLNNQGPFFHCSTVKPQAWCPVLIADKPANTFPCRCFNWALVLVLCVPNHAGFARPVSWVWDYLSKRRAQGLMNLNTLYDWHMKDNKLCSSTMKRINTFCCAGVFGQHHQPQQKNTSAL